MKPLIFRRLRARAFTVIEAIVTLVIILLLSLLLIPQFTGQANDAADSQARASAQAALSSAAALYQSTGELPNASALSVQDPDVSFVNSESSTASDSTVSVGVSSDGTVFAAAVPGGGTNCWMVQWNTNDQTSQTPTLYAKESTATSGFNCEATYALQISQCPQTAANSGDSWTSPLACSFDSTSSTTTTSGSTTTAPPTTLAETITPPSPSVIENTYATSDATMAWSWPASGGGTGTITYHWSLSPTAGSGCASGTTTATELTCANELTPGTAYTLSLYAQDSLNYTSAVDQVQATASSVTTTTNISTTTTTAVPTLSNPTLSLTSNTYGSMAWSWSASTGGTGAVTYHWQLSPWTNACTNGSTTLTSFTCASVTPGTVYTLSLYAQDSVGNDSQVVSHTDQATATTGGTGPTTTTVGPSAPAPVVSSNVSPPTGLGSETWAWAASTGGTGTVIYYWALSPQVTGCTSGQSEQTTITCAGVLTPGTAYTFAVYAQDQSGNTSGVGSITQTQSPPATAPGTPSAVTGTGAQNQSSSVSWAAPAYNGGYPITAYSVQYAVSPYTSWTNVTVSATTSPRVVTGLTNGTPYEFEVAATNAVGTGSWSAASTPITPSTVPGAPTGVSGVGGVNSSSQISWTAPSNNGGAIVTGYTVTSSPGSFTCSSSGATTCTVTGLTNGTGYTFTVTATNASGSSVASTPSSSVTPEPNVPSAPLSPAATALYQSAQVSWSAPSSTGGDPITLYSVTSTPGSYTCTSSGATTCTVTGLTDGTSYTFKVTATNAVGTGPASVSTSAITPSTTAPGAPTITTVTPGNASASLTYSAPSYTGGSAVTSYTILKATSPYTAYSTATTSPATCSTTTCTATGLTNGTTYEFEVEATNAVGTGMASTSSVPVTPITTPGAPTAVAGTVANVSSQVSWTAPASNGGSAITLYTATSNPGSFNCTSASSPCTITGLTDGTSYTFSVTATNAAGTGAASASSAPVVPAQVPGSPTGVSATSGANASSVVTWSAPGSNGGSAVTSYTILTATSPYTSYSTATTSPATCSTTTCTATGLTNGTSYEFEVEATNLVGTGAASSPSAAAVPATVPGAPTSVAATSNVNASSVVTWSAPSSTGGSAITKYVVLYATTPYSSYTILTSSATSSPYTATGLTNGISYEFEVEATNSVGTGTSSAPSAVAIPATVPGAPTGVSGTSNVNSSSAVTWSPPASNGGAAITSYTVMEATTPYTSWSTVTTSASGSAYTVTGLTNGTSYEFEVEATNAAGTGTASAPSAPAIPATVPGAPSGATASVGNVSSQVSWSAPASNGGTSITLYTVTSSPGSFTCTTTGLTCTVSGLTNGTSYSFSVTATNAAGTGPASGSSNSITPSPVPSAPLSPASSGSNASAIVSWSVPASNGGSPITGYTATSSPGSFTCTTTGLTCTVSGLTNGTTYTFTIVATNANGTGPSSVATTPVTPYTFAGAPTSVSATSNASTQSVVTWTAPASNGGSGITNYAVQYATSPYSSWTVATSSASGTAYTVTGLTNGSSYEFEVAAINAEGTGPYSAPSSVAVPATVPGAPTSVSATSNASTQSVVTWTAPASNGGASVTSYTVLEAVSPYTSFYAATTSPLTCTTTTCTATGLTNGTAYEFEVEATNPAGTGVASAASASATPATVPGVPTALSCSSNLNQSSSSSWTAPSTTGGSAITGYTVQYATSPYTTWTTASASATSPYSITGLTNGTVYECRVAASNAAGTGSYATPVSFTPATTPGAPTSLVTAPGNGQVALQWSAPVSSGGAVITAYNVSTTGGSCSTLGAFTCTVTGLTNGTSYTFSITATNAVGTGSAATINATPATTPGAPTSVAATSNANASSVVTWTAPASTGGAAISSYTILVATTPYSSFTPDASTSPATCTTTTCTVTALTNGTGYEFEVEAVNVMGNGPASSASAVATPGGPPGAPTGVVGGRANSSVSVSWTAPASNGGSTITGYTVTSSPGSQTCTTTGATGCTVSGLTNGTSYTFTVTATNAIGTGPASTASAAVIPSTTPGSPTGFSASSGSNAQSSLTWSAPSSTGGSAITGYTVTSAPSSAGCTTTGTTSCTVSGLTNGTTYTFYVVANNINGSSPQASTTATAYTVPGVPSGISAYDPGPDTSYGELQVSWSPPGSNGGSAITNYTATAVGGGSCTSSGTSCEITGLQWSYGYSITVYATNAAGSGTSGSGSGTTGALPAPSTPSVSVYTTGVGTVGFEFYSTGSSTITYTVSGCDSNTFSGSSGSPVYDTCSGTQGSSLTLYVTASISGANSTPNFATGTAGYGTPTISLSPYSANDNSLEVSWSSSSPGITSVTMVVYVNAGCTGNTRGPQGNSSYSGQTTGYDTVSGTGDFSSGGFTSGHTVYAILTVVNPGGTGYSACTAAGAP